MHIPDPWGVAINGYLRTMRAAGNPDTSINSRRQHLEHLAKRIDNNNPWTLTRDELRDWFGTHTWAIETRRGRRSSFRAFWAWGVEEGHCGTNVALGLPRVKAAIPHPRAIPEQLYQAAYARADDRTKLILRLAYENGLRRAEIAVIHVGRDLFEDLLGWSLVVHGKNAKIVDVPLSRRLAFELRALGDGYAFPGAIDGHLSPRRVGELAVDVLPAPWTLHTIRHNFGQTVYDATKDLGAAQGALRHATPNTTRTYVDVSRDVVRAAHEAVHLRRGGL
jgi:integrase/recombinase XerC